MAKAHSTAEKNDAKFNLPDTTLTSEQIEDLLIKSRIKMLLTPNAAFFGNLACRLIFKDGTKWCPTIATDGKYFYYNRNFVAALHDRSEDQLLFGVAHEVLHCVYDHMGRLTRNWERPLTREDFPITEAGFDEYIEYQNTMVRDGQLWNIANDYVVNNDLIEANIGQRIDLVEILYDFKYRGMFSEEIYEELVQEAEENGNVRYLETFDTHLGEYGSPKPGEDGDGGENGPVKMTDEEKEQVRQDMQGAVEQAARQAGKMPGALGRMIDQILNPKLNWRELLAQQIQSVIKSDYTFNRCSRKGQDSGIWLPAMDFDETIDITIAFDMSGSIGQQPANEMISETMAIMSQYTNFKITVMCFDTQVYNVQTFGEHDMDDFSEYEVVGGGGTDFDCVYNYMKEEGIEPKKLVMFTDGYPWDSWGDANYCDTLFIIHGSEAGRHPIAPFGITVPYND
jgi:predicted metal-dependent peptidase